MIAPSPEPAASALARHLPRRQRHRLASSVRFEQRAVGDRRAAHDFDDLPRRRVERARTTRRSGLVANHAVRGSRRAGHRHDRWRRSCRTRTASRRGRRSPEQRSHGFQLRKPSLVSPFEWIWLACLSSASPWPTSQRGTACKELGFAFSTSDVRLRERDVLAAPRGWWRRRSTATPRRPESHPPANGSACPATSLPCARATPREPAAASCACEIASARNPGSPASVQSAAISSCSARMRASIAAASTTGAAAGAAAGSGAGGAGGAAAGAAGAGASAAGFVSTGAAAGAGASAGFVSIG